MSAGGIIVIFLGHLSAMQVGKRELCQMRGVFKEILKEVPFMPLFSKLDDHFYFAAEIKRGYIRANSHMNPRSSPPSRTVITPLSP